MRGRHPRAVVVALIVLGLGLSAMPVAAVTASPAACTTLPTGPQSGAWLGVNLDWGNLTLAGYSTRLGHRPAVAVAFAKIPLTETDTSNLDGAADQVAQNGGVLLATLEPSLGLAAVTQDAMDAAAARFRAYNERGIPVIIRYAHEMNGSWYPWAQDPAAYVASFRAFAQTVHAVTRCTAMAWAPNDGAGYPFDGGAYRAPAGSDRARLLDTNGDGVINTNDDPYLPYYPGDEYVDWVGLSLYHWGAHIPWGSNTLPEAGKFVAMLTGTYNGTMGDFTALPDFYAEFAVAHNKPLGIFETAALYAPAQSGPSALEVKQSWWRQVFAPDLLARFPLLRLVNWFEWDKYETETHSQIDWTATQDATVRAAFRADLPSWAAFAADPPTAKPTAKPATKPAAKRVTITCRKGKLTKRVSAVKPVCPKGWKRV